MLNFTFYFTNNNNNNNKFPFEFRIWNQLISNKSAELNK